MYRIYVTHEDDIHDLGYYKTLAFAESKVDRYLETDARTYKIIEVVEREIIYRISLVAFPGSKPEDEPLETFPTYGSARRRVQELERANPIRSYRIDKELSPCIAPT